MPVYAGAWSPDGKQLAIGTVPGRVQIVAANGSGNAKAVTQTEQAAAYAYVADWSVAGRANLADEFSTLCHRVRHLHPASFGR